MKTIKNLLVATGIALTMLVAGTSTTEAKPVAEFQRIIVRTGPPVHHRVYHRRPYRRVYHRPYHRPFHRPYHRPHHRY
ncbi:hypothetical protein [Mucilaginibacter polytrichastri]|uniref:Uncharacterized protein n=1 Tax=Mucilaginibacter polytrichastri TaxID=1302689 RepID=A0A1Q5ZSW6_9SPHI|nr:hypothetical protein [Mucilaginibacter polytrichastri]OKS84865.1 hypothetical protein RG47T_0302 [Mucilaginibacter polytrichastri]SFS48496.1 hypothetical protein SAMN04487890_101773 [Mucilaginibacter polytrichastri]